MVRKNSDVLSNLYCLSAQRWGVSAPTSLYLSFIQQIFVMHPKLWDWKAVILLKTYINCPNPLSQTYLILSTNVLQGGPCLEKGQKVGLQSPRNPQSRERSTSCLLCASLRDLKSVPSSGSPESICQLPQVGRVCVSTVHMELGKEGEKVRLSSTQSTLLWAEPGALPAAWKVT